MKTTIEIADDLLIKAQRAARAQKTTLRALTEKGLRLVLKEKEKGDNNWKWKPVTANGRGLSAEFSDGDWDKLRNEIYKRRGA
jgi:hypothetical protein